MYKVQPERLKTKVVEILLGMSQEQVEELNLQISKLTDEIDNLKREIDNVRTFLTASDNANLLETRSRKEELIERLESLSREISRLKYRMRGQKGITDDLREELQEVNYRLTELQEQRDKARFKLKDFRELKNSLLVDREKGRKTREAVEILSSVDFVECPRCLQRITPLMRQREEQAKCMLCNRPLVSGYRRTQVLDKEDVVDEEIKEVELLLDKYQEDLQQLDIEVNDLIVRKTDLQAELDLQSQAYVSPFVDELERVLHERSDINAEVELLEQRIRQWEQLRNRERLLQRLEEENNKLKAQVLTFDTRDRAKISELSDHYEGFLRGVSYPNLRSARIQTEDLMPLVNGNAYTEDTGSGFLSVKVIGYHYALFRFSLENPCYYPRFLMLDSPRAFDLNLHTYNQVFLKFKEVQESCYGPQYLKHEWSE
jgi:DNA repair exonuclease SbcCD ATPase subunit